MCLCMNTHFICILCHTQEYFTFGERKPGSDPEETSRQKFGSRKPQPKFNFERAADLSASCLQIFPYLYMDF